VLIISAAEWRGRQDLYGEDVLRSRERTTESLAG
jgi:hypothetical protein